MTAALLRGRDLRRCIGDRVLLDRVDIELHSGELIGLIGPNGAGKSTLLGVLAGLDRPDSGEVRVGDEPIGSMPPGLRARRLGWLEQLAPVHWPVDVERLVALGRTPHLQRWQQPSQDDNRAIEQAIIATDCDALRHRTVTSLSGGERTRVLLARALAGEPHVLLADEPIAALDLGHQLQTMELLRRYAQSGHGCIVVLHELALAARYCDRVYLMHQGSVHASGLPDQVLTDAAFHDVYGVEVRRGVDVVPWLAPVRRIDDQRS